VLEDVLESSKADVGRAVAYFYFDFNDQQKQEPEMMVRSIVCQLLPRCVLTSSVFEGLIASCENGQSPPPVDVLLSVLRSLVGEFPHTYLVIDALDESGKREELMEILQDISQWNVAGLHVVLTSRKEHDIATTLEVILQSENIICIESGEVDVDIRSHVQHQLRHDRNFQKWRDDAATLQMIEDCLSNGAHGM